MAIRHAHVTLSAVCLAGLAGLVVLVGCGNSTTTPSADATSTASDSASPTSSDTASPSASTTDAAALPTVKGPWGDQPTISMPGGTPPSSLVTKTLVHGDGTTVASGDLLVVNYAGLLWRTGDVFDSSWQRGQPTAFGIGVGQVIAGWDKGLVGQRVGSRVLLVIPPADGYGAGGQPQAGIKPTDTLAFVVDILGAYGANDSAQGKPTPTETDSLPAVTILPKRPDVTIPPGIAPRQLIAVPVVTGTGRKVAAGDTLVVQYVGKIWATGKQFDASWDRGQPVSLQIGVGKVIPGWDKGLVGQRVGSRVLLVIPPSSGYGTQGQPQAGIKPTDTLVFAVDILAAYPSQAPNTPTPAAS